MLAAVAAGLFYPAAWIRGPLLDQTRAAEVLDGLEQRPQIAEALGELAVEETLKRVDLESVARPILGSFFDLVGDQAEVFLTETAVGVIQGGQVGPLWNILVGSTFDELSKAVSQQAEPTTPVGLNITEIAEDLFAEFGLPPGIVPIADWRVEILEPAELGQIRDVVQPVINFGPWLPWIALAFVGAAIAITRRAFVPIGAWLVGTGVVTIGFIWWARTLLDSKLGEITSQRDREAFEIVADALVTDGIDSSILAGGVVLGLGIVILIAARVLQSR